MHGSLPVEISKSNKAAVQLADQLVSDDEGEWFSHICAQLLPKDAGFALHITTGFE